MKIKKLDLKHLDHAVTDKEDLEIRTYAHKTGKPYLLAKEHYFENTMNKWF